MKRAFVFNESSWKPDLTQKYTEWVNDLLTRYPNAEFEFHQSVGSFFSETQESDWIQLVVLVIVTEKDEVVS